VAIGNHLKQKSPPVGGRAVDDRLLFDQSRHRAARVDERHQKWTVEVAGVAFRCAIGALGTGLGRVQSSGFILPLRLTIPDCRWHGRSAERV
jgi:hypothetical protein